MSTEPSTVRVNFSRPFALFPLDGVVILPHALLRLFIFEPRYRQMVADALDSSGQIAMAVFKGDDWKQEYHGNPPIQPAVCIGQIVHHDKLPDGNYRIMLQGVCRASIREELPLDGESPSTGEDRLYRTAMLEPNETGDPDEDRLAVIRQSILAMLTDEPLGELAAAKSVIRESQEHTIPTPALLEVITLSVINDRRAQYRLLAEGNLDERAAMIERELRRTRAMMNQARPQWDPEAPTGVTWN